MEEKDLFECQDELPKEVQDVLNDFTSKFEMGESLYELCAEMEKSLEPLGYTFDYGLDGIPYDLRKI